MRTGRCESTQLGGLRPREDTGLRILSRGEKGVPFCLCFSPEAPQRHFSLMTHWLNLGHRLLPTTAMARGARFWLAEPHRVPPRLGREAATSAVWAEGRRGDINLMTSLWSRRTGVGRVLVGCQQHFPPLLCWLRTGQKAGGCGPPKLRPLSTLPPSDSRHTWPYMNMEPICKRVLWGT